MKPFFPSALAELVAHINEHLAWGKVADWTNKDFQQLSEQIFSQTTLIAPHSVRSVTSTSVGLG
ncbi:MAG: hypothetical protein AAF399_14040, partial [Bacteroidota bacterium]